MQKYGWRGECVEWFLRMVGEGRGCGERVGLELG